MKVSVTGLPGEGKTTIAIIIAEALRAAGFRVDSSKLDRQSREMHMRARSTLADRISQDGTPIELVEETIR